MLFLDPAGQPDQLAAHLLVVYNTRDPDSKALADYYARRRQIPAARVLGIACPLAEEITRAQYESTIRQPITDYLFRHNWMERHTVTAHLRGQSLTLLTATRNDIWAMVLMRGMPLKIAATTDNGDTMQTQAELRTNAAAVDSELALLPVFGLPLGGFVPNPFFDTANSGELRAGPELATRLILVTRLDGPTPGIVRRMIDGCLAAETHRLAGAAVIDSRGFTDPKNGYTQADDWLRKARDLLDADGWCVSFDDEPETLPATDPVNEVALYLGWYKSNANGPWITPPNRFVSGAIAYHLHSFGAATVRSTTSNWVGPLLDHGADATMGTVYEPYLALTPHLDIFTRRLLDGDSFAEAAYAAQPGLSWMTTVVGDPLYQPFRKDLPEALAAAGPGPNHHRDWILLQQVQRGLAGKPAPDAATLEALLNVPGSGPIAHERLGDLLQNLNDTDALDATVKAYQTAQQTSVEPIDAIRIGLKLAQYEKAQNLDEQSQAELRSLRELYPFDTAKYGVSQGWFFP